MKRKIFLLALLLVMLLAVPAAAGAMNSTNYSIDWMIPFTSGGGGQISSTNYTANFSIGQTVIGNSSSTNQSISLGYWQSYLTQEVDTTIHIYLPVLMKPTP